MRRSVTVVAPQVFAVRRRPRDPEIVGNSPRRQFTACSWVRLAAMKRFRAGLAGACVVVGESCVSLLVLFVKLQDTLKPHGSFRRVTKFEQSDADLVSKVDFVGILVEPVQHVAEFCLTLVLLLNSIKVLLRFVGTAS